MKKITMLLVVALLAGVFCGCSRQPKLDTKTQIGSQKSFIAVIEKLEDEQFVGFLVAVGVVSREAKAEVSRLLDGKTAAEVIDLASKQYKADYEKALAEAKQQLKDGKVKVEELRNCYLKAIRSELERLTAAEKQK